MTSGSVVAAAHAWQGPGQAHDPGFFMFGRPPQHCVRVSIALGANPDEVQLPSGGIPPAPHPGRKLGEDLLPDAYVAGSNPERTGPATGLLRASGRPPRAIPAGLRGGCGSADEAVRALPSVVVHHDALGSSGLA